MSSAHFKFVYQGDGKSPRRAAAILSDPSCRTWLEEYWTGTTPPRTIVLDRQCALLMIGTTAELDAALSRANRAGIEQIKTSDDGWPAIWYVRVATGPMTTKTMISIAGFKDYWGLDGSPNVAYPSRPERDWYRITDHTVGSVSFEVLRQQWVPDTAGVDNWLRTYI